MKKASTSTKTVIRELAPLYGLSEMEAGVLLSMKSKKSVCSDTLEGKMMEKLQEKQMVDYAETGWFSVEWKFERTERGTRFVEAVKERKQTRVLYNLGCDLFPETANISF